MKILLIDPPFQRFMGFHRYYYPLGLAYMAAVLIKKGHDVAIYDAEHYQEGETLSWAQAVQRYDEYPKALNDPQHPVWHEAAEIVAEFHPDVIGITVLTPKFTSAVIIAGICKNIDNTVPIIVGADHPTVYPSITLQESNFDYVVRGEGERTIVELIDYLDSQRTGTDTEIDAIEGISYKNGQIKHTAKRTLIDDLDELPYPAIDSIIGSETYRSVDLGVIMGSRGCPYTCTFCGVPNVWTHRIRRRSPVKVVDEIAYLNDRYDTKYFSFRDAEFTHDKKWVISVCHEIMKRDLEISWECLTRVDNLDETLLDAMKQSGCATIRVGIESGSIDILKYMKKSLSLDKISAGARLLNKHDFYWSAYFLFGTPVETQSTIKETLDFIQAIDPPFVTLSRYSPIPGTKMCDDLEKRGLVSPEIDWSMESNQRFESHYIYNMSKQDFEESMAEVAAFIENHNRSKSEVMGRRDGRLK